jgi:hypothetical protein
MVEDMTLDQRLARIEDVLTDAFTAREVLSKSHDYEASRISPDDLMWAISEIRKADTAIKAAMRHLHIRPIPNRA